MTVSVILMLNGSRFHLPLCLWMVLLCDLKTVSEAFLMQLYSFLCTGFYMGYLFCIRQREGKYTDKGKHLKGEQGNCGL